MEIHLRRKNREFRNAALRSLTFIALYTDCTSLAIRNSSYIFIKTWETNFSSKIIFYHGSKLSVDRHGVISDKIVDTFTFLTPSFVTVIPFSPPSLSFQPPLPPKQCCAAIAVILRNKQATLNGRAGCFPQFIAQDKEWCYLVH